MKRNRIIWESWEEQALTLLYPNHPTAEIAAALKRPIHSIYFKADKLGLKKSEEFNNSPASGRMKKGDQRGANSQFKKGVQVWNKGIKGLQIGGKETQFGKGHLPHNTKQDGAINIRKDNRGVPYKHIRVGLGKWVYLQLYNWEQLHGPIPKGQILRCKDGDTLNCEPENWYLISRKKHMNKNSGAINLPDTYVAALLSVRKPELKEELLQHPELLQVARMNYQLQRTIKHESSRETKYLTGTYLHLYIQIYTLLIQVKT